MMDSAGPTPPPPGLGHGPGPGPSPPGPQGPSIEQLLTDARFGSVYTHDPRVLISEAKLHGITLNLGQAKREISKQDYYQLLRSPARRRREYVPFVAGRKANESFMSDLIYTDNLRMEPIRRILMTVDCLSRKAWAVALRSGKGAVVAAALARVLDSTDCKTLYTGGPSGDGTVACIRHDGRLSSRRWR